MRVFTKAALSIVMAAGFSLPAFAAKATDKSTVTAATNKITTTPTGFTKAEQVKYDYSGDYNENSDGTLANWGARGEDCVFISTFGESFYAKDTTYSYDKLSKKSGSTSTSSVPSSALFTALQTLMSGRSTHTTSYDETRYQYRYTDCVSNDHSKFSSFYSGTLQDGTWIKGNDSPWNREHTWPKSKSLNGNKDGGSDEADIIMLRPTLKQENSSRGNTAYGTKANGYFDPGVSTRGDCARIVLYNYVRWGNSQYMWGQSGVMESVSVLLAWMKEDPVDTWEMGRNDVVEDITGTRNVFVDYPEYAWLLFNQSVPADYVTPSKAKRAGQSGGGSQDSASSDSSSNSSSNSSSDSSSNSSSNSSSDATDSSEETSSQKECRHQYNEWFVTKKPTATQEGEQVRVCEKCGKEDVEKIPPLGGAESSSGEEEDGGLLSGCGASIGLSVSGVLLLAGCVLFLKERKN